MPRPPKTFTIPIHEDIRCIATLDREGLTQREMADYYKISIGSFARYWKQYKQ